MARVSFGSRAGEGQEYGGAHRHSRVNTPYSSLDDLTNALRQEFDAARDNSQPVCTTVELCLGLDAIIALVRPSIGPYADGGDHDLPAEFKDGRYEEQGEDAAADKKHPRAPCSAIINVVDLKAKQIVQRAASRGIMAAIEAMDGYRYSFNNAWTAKDEEGARFSFICQDSMQNKDRHANGYTRVLKNLKDPAGAERGPRKPTYDCKGSVSVKFSSSRQVCDVYYRHNAIHETVAARKAAPRTPGPARTTSSSWAKLSNPPPQTHPPADEDTGGLSAMLLAETDKSASRACPDPITARSLKRKREDIMKPTSPSGDPDRPLSLAELLMQSAAAQAAAASPQNGLSIFMHGAAAVAYDTPSWQTARPARSPGQTPFKLQYQPQTRTVSGPASTSFVAPAPAAQQGIVQQPQSSPAPASAPGLFTTMKVVDKPNRLRWPQQSYQTAGASQFMTPGKTRSVLACSNCRLAKRRCDEGRPHCGACLKTNRSDCFYEGRHVQQRAAGGAQAAGQDKASNDPAYVTTPSASGAPEDLSSNQHQSLSDWSQTSSRAGWPAQASSSLQAWGNITIANSERPASPDLWCPKRE